MRTGIYRHEKKGGVYRVLFTAINATNGFDDKPMVVYARGAKVMSNEFLRALQVVREGMESGNIFVRESEEFNHHIPDPHCDRHGGHLDEQQAHEARCTCVFRFRFVSEG